MKKNNSLEGILYLHFETGMEGTAWAFQESRYIKENVPRGFCKKCGLYLREQDPPVQVKSVNVFNEDMIQEIKETGKIRYKKPCVDGEHEEDVGRVFDPNGTHFLENGDKLTIYDPKNKKEIWSGVINLKEYDNFTEDAFGYWIHNDQKGIDRETWARYFFDEYPAELLPSKKE